MISRGGQLAAVIGALVVLGASLLGGTAKASVCAPDTPPSGQSQQSYYDASGRLTAVVDPANGSAQYAYDAAGNILSITRNPISALTVLQFAPAAGPIGTQVSICGTGFGTTANTTVKFNGVDATPTYVSSVEIRVAVPTGATSGPIAVTSPAGSIVTAASFTVGVPAAPTVSNLSPNPIAPGANLTISGSNFDPNNSKVFVNNQLAPLISVSSGAILATTPPASSGHVTVETPLGTTTTTTDLIIPPAPYTPTMIGASVRSSLGQAATVSLTSSGKVGLILFDAGERQRISFVVNSSSISYGSLCVLGPNAVQNGACIVPTRGAILGPLTLRSAGTYSLAVEPSTGVTGSATIALYNVPPDASGTLPSGGGTIALTTTAPGQGAYATFSGTAGARYSLLTQQSNGLPGTNTCNYVTILAPDGTTKVYDSGLICSASSFSFAVTLPTTGTYTIQFRPGGTAFGTVTWTLYSVPPDASGTLPSGGGTIALTTTAPGQGALATFSGTAGARYSLLTQQSNGLPGTSTCNYVTIVAPDGSTKVYDSGPVCSTSNFSFAVTLPTTGTYTIQFRPGGTAFGTVTWSLYSVPPDASGTLPSGGGTLALTTTAPGQGALATFSGTAGARYSLITQQSNGLPGTSTCNYITILAPDGTTKVYDSGPACSASNFSFALTLPTTGTYTIKFRPGGTAFGTVTWSLYSVPPDASGTLPSGSGTIALTTTAPGQGALATFSATAGARYSLFSQLSNGLPGANLCNNYITILAPDGTTKIYDGGFVCTTNFSSALTLSTTGTYTIKYAPGGPAFGTVTWTLYNLPPDPSGTVTIGGPGLPLTITTPGQSMLVSFAGSANGTAKVTVTTDAAFASQCYTVSIKNPDNTVLKSSTNCSTSYSSGVLTLPQNGTYNITIRSSGTATGSATTTVTAQ